MSLQRLVIVMLLAWFAIAGMNAPVFAEPGIVVPRAPVLSGRDPVFSGLLISPGFSKCRQLRSYYDWKCSYGGVPRGLDRNTRFGDTDFDQKPDKPAKKKVQAAKSAKQHGLAGPAKVRR